jgi:F-type H+-transporting ATPase subunit epsilon
MSESPNLHVTARAPFQVYYDGEALSITAQNKVGTFDILPGHADMFSVLVSCEVVIETDNDPVAFDINSGIITIRDDEVLLFINV